MQPWSLPQIWWCLSMFELCRRLLCNFEICILCEVHGCVACGKDGLGCFKCDNGFELVDGKCIGDETPVTPTTSPSTPTIVPPSSS